MGVVGNSIVSNRRNWPVPLLVPMPVPMLVPVGLKPVDLASSSLAASLSVCVPARGWYGMGSGLLELGTNWGDCDAADVNTEFRASCS